MLLYMSTSKLNILYSCLIGILFFYADCAYLAANNKKFTVVLDAGHGGNDPGAVGKRSREKDINLNVALKLGKLIKNNCPDTRVIYTRDKDFFVPLHKRADIANNAKADLFISIHTNSVASRSSQVYGTETYTLGLHRTKDNLEVAKKENSVILIEDDYKQRYAGFNPRSSESYIIFEFMQDKNMVQSVNFAKMIQHSFKQSNRRDKGVHQAGFLVLRATSMPSVLIELGYITNSSEEAFLSSSRGSAIMAESIYKAFIEYKNSTTIGSKETIRLDGSASISDQEKKGNVSKETKDELQNDAGQDKIIFKIQIFTANKMLPKNSREFKGLRPVDFFKENGMIKYTFGNDSDYNEILRLKRNVVNSKFKDAFIIAFKDGKKMNINQAIREFKKKR